MGDGFKEAEAAWDREIDARRQALVDRGVACGCDCGCAGGSDFGPCSCAAPNCRCKDFGACITRQPEAVASEQALTPDRSS